MSVGNRNQALLDVEPATGERWHQSLEELSARNARLERFASSIAHDLKEPVRTVTYYTQLLARSLRGKVNEREQEYLDTILENTRKMFDRIESRLSSDRSAAEPNPTAVTKEANSNATPARDLSGRG